MKTRKLARFSVVCSLLLVLLSGFWFLFDAQAQIDAFTYLIPYPADELDDQFDAGFDSAGAPPPLIFSDLIGDPIDTTISVSVFRDNTIIYYDHWEDGGLEVDPTAPTQPRSEIWGDQNAGNGIPPNFGSTDADDVLNAGDILVLQNRVTLVGPDGDRDPADIFFDGGDLLKATGGPIAVTLAVWPYNDESPPDTSTIEILYAGAWELYPTNQWGTVYHIPIGEDLEGTGSDQRPGFEVVGLNVQAVEDGTVVEIDLNDGSPATQTTLDKGEQFAQLSGVQVGAQIRSLNDQPIQVHVFTSDRDSTFEARAYTMVPFDDWTNDYVAPRSSDGDYWLYNPNGSDLEVTVTTSINPPMIITIPPNSTIKYPASGLSAATGVQFTAADGRSFYGVTALDEDQNQDWGYALQPVSRLSSQTLIGWGPGNNNGPPPDGDQSQVYVTALADTVVYLDYDNNPATTDISYPVTALEEVGIVDAPPSAGGNHDLTGAFLYTQDGTPFVSVWGQDENAPDGLPSIDVGTSIVPLSSLNLQKSYQLVSEADCNGTISAGDTVRFELFYFNNSFREIPNVTIEDALPSALDYVPDSTVQTDQNGTRSIDDAGNTPFPLDEGGLSNIDVPGGRPGGTGSITFDAIVNDTAVNRAEIHWQNVLFEGRTDSTLVLLPTQADPPLLLLDKTLIDPADGMVTVGQAITFSLTITNSTNSVTITKLPLENTFNEDYLSFRNAEPPETVAASGVISWTDLTTAFGPLTPGQSVTVLISFTVDQVPPGNDTTVRATALNAERDDGQPPLVCYTDADVTINPAPTPTPTPTSTHTPTATPTSPPSNGGGGGDDDDDGDGDGESPPPPTATATPTVDATAAAALPAPPQPTPALPVTILPETGLQETTSTNLVATGALVLIVGGVGGVTIFYVRRRMKRKHLS